VLSGAYGHNAEHRARTAESLQKVRALCEELGLLHRPFGALWARLGLG
jgi:hypothetical protein